MNYILIGIVFMFCIEFLSKKKSVEKHLITKINLGWPERILGILFWPICLGVFIYYFLTNLLNK